MHDDKRTECILLYTKYKTFSPLKYNRNDDFQKKKVLKKCKEISYAIHSINFEK